jgi:hypothetical protein
MKVIKTNHEGSSPSYTLYDIWYTIHARKYMRCIDPKS